MAQRTTQFWRRFGNMYTQKLIWYCDNCKKKIKGTKYQETKLYFQFKDTILRDFHYCERCFKLK